MVGKDEAGSSNLPSSSTEARCPARDSGFLCCHFCVFPYWLSVDRYGLEEAPHSGVAGLPHFIVAMVVNVERKGGGRVTEVGLYRLDAAGADSRKNVGAAVIICRKAGAYSRNFT